MKNFFQDIFYFLLLVFLFFFCSFFNKKFLIEFLSNHVTFSRDVRNVCYERMFLFYKHKHSSPAQHWLLNSEIRTKIYKLKPFSCIKASNQLLKAFTVLSIKWEKNNNFKQNLFCCCFCLNWFHLQLQFEWNVGMKKKSYFFNNFLM